ncbi:hypothetical protein D5085_16230 [Ectothiorhodospiraceae bacterium BW-2]|nr:hypothetical protein D5085_16230 [Ectothiorhodospiraceae bacterium BW-2]
MNDPLRITLIIIAVLVILALVIHDRLKARRPHSMGAKRRQKGRRHETPAPTEIPSPHAEDDFDIILRTKPAAVSQSPTKANTETTSEAVAAPSPPPPSPSPPPPQLPEEVLTLTIRASSGYAFAGESLREIIEQLGFQFGKMSIFHRMDRGEPLISLANMVNPGTFPDGNWEEFTTPGLAIFAQLPATQPGSELVEELLQLGEVLANRLQAHLCDGQGQPLAEDVKRQMRAVAEPYPPR